MTQPRFRYSKIIMRSTFILASLVIAVLYPPFASSAKAGVPLLLGVNTSIRDGSNAIPAAHSLGANAVRIDAPWSQIELAKGKYQIPAWLESRVDAARSLNMTPLLILEYGNRLYGGAKPHTPDYRHAFARYATFVVTHFKGRVTLFDLWNEWEGTTGGGPPGSAWDYVQLAQTVYPAIKQANPDAVVLSGGIYNLTNSYTAAWFKTFLAIGGLHYIDALSLHPYDFQMGPNATPETAIEQVDEIHRLANSANAGRPVDVYISEMGWPDYTGAGGQPSQTVATYIERFTLLAAARPYIRGLWWYDLRNQGEMPHDREANFGLETYGFGEKPQSKAFVRLSDLLNSVSAISVSGPPDRPLIVLSCDNSRNVSAPATFNSPSALPHCRSSTP